MGMFKEKKFIVFGGEHYNPLTVIRILGEKGIEPIYVGVKHKANIASSSKYLIEANVFDTLNEAFDFLVKNYGDEINPPYVINTDDVGQAKIDENYDEIKDKFITFNAGKAGRIIEFMNKKTILDIAEKHGVAIPKTVVVDNGTISPNIEYPIITKSISPIVGGWKSDVFICNNEEELKEAFKKIKSPKVLIQRYVEKKNEICIDGFAVDHGKKVFMPMYTTYNYNIKGYYSPYMTAHSFTDAELKHKIQKIMEDIGFEGIFSFELIQDEDDNLYFMEINFRNSPWNYAAAINGMPYPLMWAEAMETKSLENFSEIPFPEDFTCMIEPIDYQKRVVEGGVKLSTWLLDFKNTNCHFYLHQDDLRPYEIMVDNWKLLS